MKPKSLLLFFGCLFSVPSLCCAKIRLSQTKPVQIPVNEFDQKITSKDVQKVIPLDLRPSEDAGYVAGKVGDRAFNLWMKSSAVQNTSFGRTATQVEQSMKTEVSLVGTGEGENKVDHKVAFQILAFQAMTRMTYKGWINAEVNHDARARATLFQISEKVWNDKDMTLSHVADSEQGLSSLGLRWNF